MLQVHQAFTFKDRRPKPKPMLVLALVLIAASFLLTDCSGISASSPASNVQTALPTGYVGNAYRGVLPVSGGNPQPFVLSSGELPPGLALDAITGAISGVPTRAGTFTFAVAIYSAPVGSLGHQDAPGMGAGNVYAIAVLSNPGTIQISPVDPSIVPGGKLQFTAAVTDATSPVTWSTTAGAVSSSGLFTAPTSGTPQSITITASSQIQGGVQASTVVNITNPQSPSATQTCGPPAYLCSRIDREIVQMPSITPNVGGLIGANAMITDPDFGNQIVRITDANTNPSPDFKNRSYVSSASGSADDNLWNVDSTLFVVQDTGANSLPFTFNPSSLQAARMYVSSFPATNGLKLGVSGDWSRVNPNLFYTFSGTAISKYDFTDRNNPPSPQAVYDFTSSSNCLPAGFTATWSTRGGLSGDDTVFAMAFSNNGNQGTGVYAAVYKAGSGCSILNTKTGQVGGDWGAKGTINIADRWTIHNAKLSKDGNWLIIVSDSCTSASCTVGPYFWQIGTTNIGSCGQGPHCTGHWTEGYSHWINNNQAGNQESRPISDPAAALDLTPILTIPNPTVLDEHASWNNADPADGLPFVVSFYSSVTPFPAPWYNEVTAVAPDGSGKVWRFAHSFITGKSQVFDAYYGIGSVSQDGRFFLLSSDWMGTLGSESGTSGCTIGQNCRSDAFVVVLN